MAVVVSLLQITALTVSEPCAVRREEVDGVGVGGEVLHLGSHGDDKSGKDTNVGKSKLGLLGSEEEWCPNEVHCQLGIVETQGIRRVLRCQGRQVVVVNLDCKVRCVSHHAVEDCPNRSEGPVGWVSRWLLEAGIPR